jgi:ATP-dependent DNA helicase DinG
MTELPPPYALGLPSHFTAWRPGQEYGLTLILDAPTRFVAINAPTGFGKSLDYMAAGVLHGGRTVVLTANKNLQDQLYGEYQSLDLIDVRGRGSYPCQALAPGGEWTHLGAAANATCDDGPCHAGLPCSLKEIGCEAYDRIRTAKYADLVSTNYALWMALHRYSQGLGEVDLLILDEAHKAPDELAQALQVRLSKWLCHALDLHPLAAGSPIPHWIEWAAYHEAQVRGILESLEGKPPTGKSLQYRKWLRQGAQVLWAMKQMDGVNWIEDSQPDAVVFEILNPARYAKSTLFQGADKVVLLSATLTKKTLALLGIPPEDVTWWEAPSTFPVHARQVTYVPTVKVDYRMTPQHEAILAARFDQYLSARPARKGITHTVSYSRAKRLYDRSGYKPRLRLHTSDGDKAGAVITAFKKSSQPEVLLSPSMDMGIDLPDDQCRFTVILKLPFPSTQSKIVQARAALDPEYVPYLMCQRLEQSVGRDVRHQGDWSEHVILDDNFRWAWGKYKHLLTKGFREAVVWGKTLPVPYQP